MPRGTRAELSRAVELHRTGRLDEAIGQYRRLVKANPGTFSIQRLYVLALLQAGRFKTALSVARRARDDNPAEAHAQLIMGMALRATGEAEQALAAFNAAAALDPSLSEAHYLAGNALGGLGRLDEAISRYDMVISRDPRAVEARAGRAAALSMLGQGEEALADLESLTDMQPWAAEHWVSKAEILLVLGRAEAASHAVSEAARLAPDLVDAHRVRAQAMLELGRLTDARDALEVAVRLAPEDAPLANHLISLLRLTSDMPAALRACDRALTAHPESAAFLQHRAEARRELGDREGALADAQAAVIQEPDFAPAAVSLARTLSDLGREEDARAALVQALERDPDSPDARYLAACDHLVRGRWTEGWAGYEQRARILPAPFSPLPLPRWDGNPEVETLVVLGEKGDGDQILFARLVRLLADRGLRVVLVTEPRLVPLLSTVDARVQVVSGLSGLDLNSPGVNWIPLGSLPGLVGPDPGTWPVVPYLRAAPQRIARWSGLRQRGRLMVGLNWRGAPTRGSASAAPLDAVRALSGIADTTLVGLPAGEGTPAPEMSGFGADALHPGADCDRDGAFLDTIAILQHVDLVVTTESPLAHLAGARGLPTFLAIRANPDWRWGHGGLLTPFYPSVRVVRQERPGDWAGVFSKIGAALRAAAGQPAA